MTECTICLVLIDGRSKYCPECGVYRGRQLPIYNRGGTDMAKVHRLLELAKMGDRVYDMGPRHICGTELVVCELGYNGNRRPNQAHWGYRKRRRG